MVFSVPNSTLVLETFHDLFIEFEKFEIHSSKVFNEIKEKRTNTDTEEDSIGPMVSCG